MNRIKVPINVKLIGHWVCSIGLCGCMRSLEPPRPVPVQSSTWDWDVGVRLTGDHSPGPFPSQACRRRKDSGRVISKLEGIQKRRSGKPRDIRCYRELLSEAGPARAPGLELGEDAVERFRISFSLFW